MPSRLTKLIDAVALACFTAFALFPILMIAVGGAIGGLVH